MFLISVFCFPTPEFGAVVDVSRPSVDILNGKFQGEPTTQRIIVGVPSKPLSEVTMISREIPTMAVNPY